MLIGHEILRVPDLNKENDLQVEVNFNPSDKESNECKIIRLIFPGGKTALVKREHLHAIMFAIGTPKQQRSLTPQSMIKKRRFEGLVTLTASKDIQKGEKIVARCFHDLPDDIQEVIMK